MTITREMRRKAKEHFETIKPEILYKDLVENYGLPKITNLQK